MQSRQETPRHSSAEQRSKGRCRGEGMRESGFHSDPEAVMLLRRKRRVRDSLKKHFFLVRILPPTSGSQNVKDGKDV
ncbi:hypothetical protein GOODEAATRI_008504 [Goodea atripinnis]|uniref:Uncharacterized protein n=1 Tax=Goodea atripinnis TaxID=208336 RepID=A0ABV0NK18_9TELE